VQPEKLEGDQNATFLDYCSGNDGVCGIAGVSPCQCLGELWAEEGGKSVLHAGSPLGTRPRLWQLGDMPRARERRCRAEAPQGPSSSVTRNEDSPELVHVPIGSNHSPPSCPCRDTPPRSAAGTVFAGIHVFLAGLQPKRRGWPGQARPRLRVSGSMWPERAVARPPARRSIRPWRRTGPTIFGRR
jgi:hypothetical protein